MYIGKAAELSGTTIKSIRYYEDIGLLPQPKREGKYRVYDPGSVEVLRFIKCAQQLGFKLKELQHILRDYTGGRFPWDLAQAEIQRKKREICAEILQLETVFHALESFEEDLQASRHECPLEAEALELKKKRPSA